MTTVTTYKSKNTDLSTICNNSNSSYYGGITSGYQQSGTDIGNIFSVNTFSTVSGTITPCGYNSNIIQYNTGSQWSWVNMTRMCCLAISATGQYVIAGGVDTNGTIWYSLNYGIGNWSPSNSLSIGWSSVSSSASGVYAVACSKNQKIYYSSTYGVNWTLSTVPLVNTWRCISMSASGQYAVACSNEGNIVISSDFGVNWDNTFTAGGLLESVSISASGQYVVATKGDVYRIYYSLGYGDTGSWEIANSVGAVALWTSISISASGQYVVACASGGSIYYSSNYGKDWTSASINNNWRSISISETGQYAVACTNLSSGQIYYSSTYGKSWSLSNSPSYSWAAVVISRSGKYAIAAQDLSDVYRSSNTSITTVTKDLTEVFEPLYKYNTWNIMPSKLTAPQNMRWSSVSMSATGQYAVACMYGTTTNPEAKVYYSSDYGVSWTVSNSISAAWNTVSISGTGKYAIAAVESLGTTGKIYYSSNYGQTWTASNSVISNWKSVSISSSGKYAIASRGGYILSYSSNYGASWADITLPANANSNNPSVFDVKISASGKYIFAATASGMYYSSNYILGNWTAPPNTINDFRIVSMSASGKYGITAKYNSDTVSHILYYSSDYGVNWTQSNSIVANWTSVSMSASGQYVVAGVFNGKIYYSSDYGVNWAVTNSIVANWDSISISESGQYAIANTWELDGVNSNIYYCIATN